MGTVEHACEKCSREAVFHARGSGARCTSYIEELWRMLSVRCGDYANDATIQEVSRNRNRLIKFLEVHSTSNKQTRIAWVDQRQPVAVAESARSCWAQLISSQPLALASGLGSGSGTTRIQRMICSQLSTLYRGGPPRPRRPVVARPRHHSCPSPRRRGCCFAGS